MKTADFRIAIPIALMAALSINGAAFAKNGSDDPPPASDDRGGAGGLQPSDDPPGDDHGATDSARGSDDPPGDDRGTTDSTRGSDDPPGDDRGGPGSTGDLGRSRIRIRLGDDAGTRVKSKFNYKVNTKVKELKGVLKLPLPNDLTGITDKSTAEEALMTASLAHRLTRSPDVTYDTPYAVCTFVFDRINSTQAQYVFDVKQNPGSAVKQKQGTCDTDPTMAGIQPGVPGIHTDDRVTVEFHIDPPPDAEPFTIELGQGTF